MSSALAETIDLEDFNETTLDNKHTKLLVNIANAAVRDKEWAKKVQIDQHDAITRNLSVTERQTELLKTYVDRDSKHTNELSVAHRRLREEETKVTMIGEELARDKVTIQNLRDQLKILTTLTPRKRTAAVALSIDDVLHRLRTFKGEEKECRLNATDYEAVLTHLDIDRMAAVSLRKKNVTNKTKFFSAMTLLEEHESNEEL